MAVFSYIALKNSKDIVKGKIEAENIREAREQIRNLGFIPTKIHEDKVKTDKVVIPSVRAGRLETLSLQERIDFTSTLQILAQSGIPIIESLMFIETDAAKKKVRNTARELRRQSLRVRRLLTP